MLCLSSAVAIALQMLCDRSLRFCFWRHCSLWSWVLPLLSRSSGTPTPRFLLHLCLVNYSSFLSISPPFSAEDLFSALVGISVIKIWILAWRRAGPELCPVLVVILTIILLIQWGTICLDYLFGFLPFGYVGILDLGGVITIYTSSYDSNSYYAFMLDCIHFSLSFV